MSDNKVLLEIEFEILSSSTRFLDPGLQLRAKHASHTPISTSYKVLVDGREAAFLTIDRNTYFKVLFVYELMVRSDERRKGLATRVMERIERLAFEEGWPEMRLRPQALDNTISDADLISWYQLLGFSWCADERGTMCKPVSVPDSI